MPKAKKKTSVEQVTEFHETFGHPISEVPFPIDQKRAKLRINLKLEETAELIHAVAGYQPNAQYLNAAIANITRAIALVEKAQDYEFASQDMVGIADALGDCEYVNTGAALEWGIPLEAVAAEIHASNMTKAGPDGKPIYDENGKVMKGENYRPPNIAQFIVDPRDTALDSAVETLGKIADDALLEEIKE